MEKPECHLSVGVELRGCARTDDDYLNRWADITLQGDVAGASSAKPAEQLMYLAYNMFGPTTQRFNIRNLGGIQHSELGAARAVHV